MNEGDDSNNMVPSTIKCGTTLYMHTSEGGTDIYVAKAHLDAAGGDSSGVPPEHRWRYCVAKNQDNTVYFSNKATMQSVWVLPDLGGKEGDEEPTMEPQGWTARARRGSNASVTGSDAEGATKSAVHTPTGLTEKSPILDANQSAADRVRQQVRARLEAARLAKKPKAEKEVSVAAEMPSTTEDTNDDTALSPLSSHQASPVNNRDAKDDSDGDMDSSVGNGSGRRGRQERLEAIRQRRAASNSSAGGGSVASSSQPREGSGSTDGRLSARDRLAAFRARRSGAATPAGSATRSPDPEPLHNPEPYTNNFQHGESLKPIHTASSPHTSSSSPHQHINHPADSSAAAILRERQQQILEEDAALVQQRQAMIAEERAAMDRKRRAIDAQRAEEEALAKVLEKRREMEARRLELFAQEKPQSNQQRQLYGAAELNQSIEAVEAAMERERAQFEKVEANSSKAATAARAQALQYSDSVASALVKAMEEQRREAHLEEERRLESERMSRRQAAVSNTALNSSAVTPQEDAYFSDTPTATHNAADPRSPNPPAPTNAKGRVVPGYKDAHGTERPYKVLLSYNTQLMYMGEVSTTPQEYSRNLLLQRKRQADTAASLIDMVPTHTATTNNNGNHTKKGTLSTAIPHSSSHIIPFTKEGHGVYYYNAKAEGVTEDGVMSASDPVSASFPHHSSNNANTPSAVHPNAKSYYDGKWEDDRPSDVSGVLSAPRSAYQGPIKAGRMDGTGTIQTQQLYGSLGVQNGTPHGSAVLESASGESFAGVLNGGQIATPGKLSLAPVRAQGGVTGRDEVEWVWKSNAAPGTGRARIRYATGDVFVGEVTDYMPEGQGCYRFREGHMYTGAFQKGCIVGRGVYEFANGNVYEGDVNDGYFHGKGAYCRKGEFLYEGHWSQGQMHGTATVTFANGDVWEGVFVRDVRGNGRYVKSTKFLLSNNAATMPAIAPPSTTA